MPSPSGSYNIDDTHRDRDSEIQRLAAQAQLGWDKEARTLSWFGLRDGMSILEVGSGPGFITEKLLERCPHSPITCVELDPSLIRQAEGYLESASNRRVQFVEASIMDTGLPDNQFDFAYARLLFQHLPDPIGAAREVRRVLKPGGKFVIYDVDDEMSNLFEPALPEWAAIFETFGQAQAARGGNRHIGRRLFRMLQAAGFQSLDLEVTATHSDAEGMDIFLPQIDPDMWLLLVKDGLISERALENARAARARFLDSPAPYIMMLSWMACGEK